MTSDLSTSEVSASKTGHSSSPSPQTRVAVPSVNPRKKTDALRHSLLALVEQIVASTRRARASSAAAQADRGRLGAAAVRDAMRATRSTCCVPARPQARWRARSRRAGDSIGHRRSLCVERERRIRSPCAIGEQRDRRCIVERRKPVNALGGNVSGERLVASTLTCGSEPRSARRLPRRRKRDVRRHRHEQQARRFSNRRRAYRRADRGPTWARRQPTRRTLSVPAINAGSHRSIGRPAMRRRGVSLRRSAATLEREPRLPDAAGAHEREQRPFVEQAATPRAPRHRSARRSLVVRRGKLSGGARRAAQRLKLGAQASADRSITARSGGVDVFQRNRAETAAALFRARDAAGARDRRRPPRAAPDRRGLPITIVTYGRALRENNRRHAPPPRRHAAPCARRARRPNRRPRAPTRAEPRSPLRVHQPRLERPRKRRRPSF